jgi:capsular polysaccharide biosynthesis protein
MIKLPKLELTWLIERRYRLQTLVNGVGSISKTVQLICESKKGQSKPPEFLAEFEGKSFAEYDGSFFSPAIYLHEVEGASVIGRTEFVLRDETLYFPHVVDVAHDVFMAELEGRAELTSSRELKLAAWPRKRRVPEGLSLLGQCNGNYLHFLTEAMTRLALADQIPELDNVPLLVENNLHPKLYEALDLLNSKGREIIPVAEYEQVYVNRLFYITPPCYTPPETRTWFEHGRLAEVRRNQFVFSAEALKQLRQCCTKIAFHYVPAGASVSADSFGWASVKARTGNAEFTFFVDDRILHSAGLRRLFLERRAASVGNGRLVINEGELWKTLECHQFATINVADRSFAEQVAILSGAEVVVSAVGASLGNLIFAEPGVRAILLSPTYPGASYFYFANLLAALGHDITYVLGRQSSQGEKNPYNRNFWVPINLVVEAL